MQVSVETTTGLERRLTVGIPAETIDSEVQKRLQQATKTVRINGFRKGKVPLKVVKQRYGEGVRQEVVGDAINKSFYEAVTQEKLRPAGQPNIEPNALEEGKDVEFVATFEVYPEVELADLSQAEFTRLDAEIEDADIDTMIETLRKSQGAWQEVDAAAEDGNRVKISYVGKRDGEAFDGGTAEGQSLILGSKSMIPGFEDGLLGAKAGDEKTLELKFPEDYHVDSLKGADVVFDVSVSLVEAQILPEVNEEFFAKFGVSDGDEASFREDVKGNMEREKKRALRAKLKEQVMDALIEANKVELPKALVQGEINALRGQTMQQYGAIADKIDVQSLLPDEMFKEQAERRTALGLIISEFVKAEKLEADKDKVREIIEETASTYESPEEVVNYYYSNEQLLASVEAAALEDQVVDALLEKAQVKDEKVSYEEAIKPAEK
ncbi:trigger factor [Agaribacterium haliotis]|uniref:trigger factor n=1 Tax=Agaribacterium haliotis TaxID=2013869 RepID=UPI000BB559C0|nr:trigger factor [Agaribacterium haliotis]